MYAIRPATEADVTFLVDVAATASHPDADFDRDQYAAWTRRMIEDLAGPSTTSVIEVNGRPAGRLRVARTAASIELCGIQLAPSIQNQGIGTAIIRALQEEAAARGVALDLGVERTNPNARRLYERLGFRKYAEDDREDKLRWRHDIWTSDVAGRYDDPGDRMFSTALLDATTARLAELAGTGRALEFAIGTGRVAVPLAERGVPVSGIELSPPMVEVLRTKTDESTIPVTIGDMAAVRVPGEFSLVYLVYNTISNLLTQEDQVACFRNAARHLSPGGRFVIELWVPELRRLPPGTPATVGIADPGYILLDTYDVLHQHVTSYHFTFTEGGTEARLERSPHRYIWPAELDLMAQLAGFTLESRHADWSGGEFTADSPSHVSVYRLP
ncbi:GNAT family N-acetyltransferase [Kribbella antibiotica]|uniref:GNAT family N-acetyltransferase n=1 Tax=Kribbella antibiotica TaxID=190195 RepID=A0A4R4ZJF1_9ACTN|nr:GNAT family N-acetyltransferase [Kribbella antibiotica]TDD58763.1 GNAT family N-acetyltransferase [Kribbella antibiotica]